MASHFYFNSENDHPELDPEGIELPDIAAAQREALRLLGRMLQDADGDGIFFKLQLSATEPTEPT
jgi:hypothetical protein